MRPHSITRLIFDSVPQVYEARAGKFPVGISIEQEESRLFTAVPISDSLQKYFKQAEEIWNGMKGAMQGQREISKIVEREWIQQKFVVAWLEENTQIYTWNLIIDYFQRLSRRTLENETFSKTIVIEPGKSDQTLMSLNDETHLKIFDCLGTSPFTYYRVDERLGIKSLNVVSLKDVKELSGYRFYPDILHPVLSTLKDSKSVVVHFNENRSLLIANRDGMIASKHRDSWTIYDVDHMIQSVGEVLKNQIRSNFRTEDPTCVACSLFQILFDMSIERHGGLVIIDRVENLRRYVMKGIEKSDGSALNAIFTHSPFNGLEFSVPEVRKLVELSCVDGAVVLDLEGNLVQVASMVIPHPQSPNAFGTRESAAYSAAKYGATALKVSTDGQVSMFFTTPDLTEDDVHRFDFL